MKILNIKKLFIVIFLFFFIFDGGFAQEVETKDYFELYYTTVGHTQSSDENSNDSKEYISLSKYSFELIDKKIRNISKPELIWKKDAIQITYDRFFKNANTFWFETRSNPDQLKIGKADEVHFFDLEFPKKIYSVKGGGDDWVVIKKQNRTTLLTSAYSDSLYIKSYTMPKLDGKIEKDSNIWATYGHPAFVNLDAEGNFYICEPGLETVKLPVRIDPKLLLEHSISDTRFLLRYQDTKWVVIKPSKYRKTFEDCAWGKEVLVYNKERKTWAIYKIDINFPEGVVIGDYYVVYDEYSIEGYDIYIKPHMVDMRTGEIQWLLFPINTKVIGIQENLWILSLPGRLKVMQKIGPEFREVGVFYREDAEKITFAWIKKISKEVPATK